MLTGSNELLSHLGILLLEWLKRNEGWGGGLKSKMVLMMKSRQSWCFIYIQNSKAIAQSHSCQECLLYL